MRITNIDINNFAAVRDFHLEPAGITVIHGPNESLKTMILDAMLLTLFSQIGFPRVRDRYSEEDLVGATASIVMNNGREFTLGGKGNLERTFNLPRLSARNLMVVRTGELGFHEERGWWGSIRDNLTGFEGGLGKVVGNIRDEVGLTDGGDWRDRQGQRIRTEIGELEERQRVLEAALSDAGQVGRLEVELNNLQRDLQNCREALDNLRTARERDRYLRASGLIRDFSNDGVELGNYQQYEDDDYREWLDAERESGEAGIRLDNLKTHRTELEREIENKHRERDTLSRQIGELEGREINVFAGMEKLLVKIESTRQEVERESLNERPLGVGSAITSAAGGIFLYFAISRGGLYFAGLAGSAAAALFLWLRWANSRKKRLVFNSLQRELLVLSQAFVPDAREVEEVRQWLNGQRRDLERMRGERRGLDREIQNREEQLGKAGEELSKVEKEEQKASGLMKDLRDRTGCSTHQELRGKLDRKRQLEAQIGSLRGEINRLLEAGSEAEWPEVLKKLEMYKNAQGVWDQQEYDRLKQMLEAVEQSLEDIRNRFQSARDTIIRAGCSTPEEVFIELDGVVGQLEEYRLGREAALAAVEVLNEMAAEQDTIINSVIGDGPDSAQAYFERITGGKYVRVYRDGDVVRTRMPDGTEFSIEQLSTGTQAQLYFALRVSLIKRIFDEPPFLLLDDPFLSADEGRREAIIDFSIELAREGWQIIYFTVDGRVPGKLERAGNQLFSLVSLSPA